MEASQKKAKASLKQHEAEQGRLKEELSLEEVLKAARREISDLKAQRKEAKWQVVKVYKASKKCRQGKLCFAQPAFAEGMDDIYRRVLKRFPDLNLDFLDEDESDKDYLIESVPASGAAGAERSIDAPSF